MSKQSEHQAPHTGHGVEAEPFLRAFENATAYPVMVTDASAPGGSRGGPADETQRMVDNALRAVLGGRTRVDDPNGLKAALARSFVEDRVDGRRVYRNVPRGSVADTAGESEVSGLQGALIAHAREVFDHGLPLLEGLRSLVPTVDADDVAARASVVRSNVIAVRDEFGRRDGPRPAVISSLLGILLGEDAETDPDKVGGAVGRLRADLGLAAGLYANSVEDELQLTNYRLLAEYVVGLRTAWETASPVFDKGAFVGSQLRQVELTMQTITESLDQVRVAMDSVFVGEAERRIHRVDLSSLRNAPMTIEGLLDWAEETVSPDSVTLIRDGGRIAIADSLLPTTRRILDALEELTGSTKLTGGLGAPRVRASLEDLRAQWRILTCKLLEPLAVQSVPVPDVRGMRLSEACDALHKAGFRPKVSGDAVPSSVVLWTDPAPGQQELARSIVKLAVENCPPDAQRRRTKFYARRPPAPWKQPDNRSDDQDRNTEDPACADPSAQADPHHSSATQPDPCEPEQDKPRHTEPQRARTVGGRFRLARGIFNLGTRTYRAWKDKKTGAESSRRTNGGRS